MSRPATPVFELVNSLSDFFVKDVARTPAGGPLLGVLPGHT